MTEKKVTLLLSTTPISDDIKILVLPLLSRLVNFGFLFGAPPFSYDNIIPILLCRINHTLATYTELGSLPRPPQVNFLLDFTACLQVTYLRCGGMILCTAINHCLCDGIGTSQFLHAWAHMTAKPNLDLPILPFHTRHVLKPRNPPQVTFAHHGYTKITQKEIAQVEINQYLQSQPLVPASLTFTASHVLRLKRNCVPSLKCTTFEALASHTWRSWVRSLDLSPSLNVKLLFSVNVRKKLNPELPQGYYGNGFVLGCAETGANDLVNSNLYHTIKLVQHAKSSLTDDYVRSMVDLLEDKNYKTDLSASLVISQWSKLGLEDLDFGEGKPLHMGPVTSDIYCLFLPVIGDSNSMRVLVSMPENVVERFVFYMTAEFLDGEEKENNNNN